MSLSNAHCTWNCFLLTFKYIFIENLVLPLKFSSSKLPWICHSNNLERDKLIFSHVAKIVRSPPRVFKLWSRQPPVRPKQSSEQTLCVHWALRYSLSTMAKSDRRAFIYTWFQVNISGKVIVVSQLFHVWQAVHNPGSLNIRILM